jgi:iron complex outermembrane receptor protein
MLKRAPIGAAALLYLGASSAAWAQAAQAPGPAPTLEPIEVIGTTPSLGTGIDRDKVPANTHSLSAEDLRRAGTPDLTGTLQRDIPSININDNQANPFQPDILYRGFEASPVLGTPQGLAVYQNGVRINEAFGDTVNWDLVPDIAINRINLVGSNPVFGLNALGGALAIEMKNGFTYHDGEAEISGGSFGRRVGSFEYGREAGVFAGYIAGNLLNEDGWRDFSPSELRQLYAVLSARTDRLSVDLSFSGAKNRLSGIGATPIDEVNARREAVFTRPQQFLNDLGFVTLNGSYEATDALTVQSSLYYRQFHQRIINGNTTGAQACDPSLPNLLCFGDGFTPLIGTNGSQISSTGTNGQPLGQLDRNGTDTQGLGGSLEASYRAPLFERENNLVLGASLDHANVDYKASSELATIDASLLTNGTGIFIDQPDGSLGPVKLNTTNSYYGVYATDTFNLTPDLAITASGRYNLALVHLIDKLGTSLNGNTRYSRFNPALGATYKLTSAMTVYAGYSEANRAPTAGELACSDPARPCALDNFLASDPPNLRQVVAHSYEAGLRGKFAVPDLPGGFTWNLGLFRTDLDDDIIAVSSVVFGRGFFQNAGSTRRQGIEAGLSYKTEALSLYANYGLTDATFQSPLLLSSPSNPTADANGNIQVRPGDHLPGVPQHRIKAGADYKTTPSWTFGGSLTYASGQYYRGDESNKLGQIPGYEIVDIHSTYKVAGNVELFAKVQNLFNAKYETFGVLGDASGVPLPGVGITTNPRFVSPGAPIAAYGGLRVTF